MGRVFAEVRPIGHGRTRTKVTMPIASRGRCRGRVSGDGSASSRRRRGGATTFVCRGVVNCRAFRLTAIISLTKGGRS